MPTRKHQLIFVNLDDEQKGRFAISPSALDKIKHDLNQAEAKNKIGNLRERSIANVALLAAAIETAHEEGTRVVKVVHVTRGWRERLSLGPGCDPPRSCIRISVLEQIEQIKQRSRPFREMMSEIE